MAALARIDDDRGRFAGLAAVLLGVFVFVLLSRNEDWSAFVRLLVSGVPAALVLGAALARPREVGPPPGWVSALLVVGFALSGIALFALAEVLGADGDDVQPSTVTWIALVLAGVFGFIALRRNSAVCTLLAASSLVVAVIAAVDWVFSPEGSTTYRYVLLALGLALVAAGVALYRERGRHGVVLTVVGGLAVLALAITFASDFISPFFGGEEETPSGIAWGWELVVLGFGIALAAVAALTREPGPGYVAAALLLAFVALTAAGGDDFVGWPLVLLLATAGALALAFRPGASDTGPARTPDEPHEVRL